MPNELPKYEDFAIFEHDKEPPPLPIEGMEDIKAFEMQHGGFITTVIKNTDSVIKIHRIIRMNDDGGIRDQNPKNYDFLEPRDEDPEKKLNNAVNSIYKYQKFIESHLEIQQKYIGKFLPKRIGSIIAESPRQYLAERYVKDRRTNTVISREILETIPKSEIALIEVWESVGPENSLQDMPYETIAQITNNNENFKRQMKEFSESVLDMLREEHVMIDLCDFGGIRTEVKKRVREPGIKTLEGTIQFIEGNLPDDEIVYPRNLSFGPRGVQYYDTYPLMDFPTKFKKEQIEQVIDYVANKDTELIKRFVENSDTGRFDDRLTLVNYVALLDYYKNL
jgi:hypothetical protein